MCREARDGACVGYTEENKIDRTSARVITVGAEETCPKATSDSSAETGKCKNTKCDVTIGGNPYCSQCSKLDEHLVDGKCVAANTDSTNNCVSNNQGSCTSCANSYFMYQSGCYQTGDQNPGNTLCTAASDGKCTTAAEGHFVPPGATASKQSVVKCDDTTGVEVSTNTYKGVLNCEVCRPSATPAGARTDSVAVCTKCGNSKYLKADGSGCVESSGCASGTEFAKEDTNNGNRCVPCGDKTDDIADCQTCSKPENALKCLTCSESNKPSVAGTGCFACPNSGATANCANCNEANVCALCTNG